MSPGRAIRHEDVRGLEVTAWCDRLERSASEATQDGLTYPGFPPEAVQRQFVGSAGADALREISNFYRFIQRHLPEQDRRGRLYLDFGAGWGRVARFFLRDFPQERMFGVDIDPDMIAFCQQSGQPGTYSTVDPKAALPFAAGRFGLITAYSVFTHLPPALFTARLADLIGLLAPGGLLVITVEPPRFVDFVESIDPGTDNAWLAGLSAQKPQLPRLREDLERHGIGYLASGGGEHRDQDIYGDTVVTAAYLRDAVGKAASLIEFVDEPQQFWQAVAVIRRRDPARDVWRPLMRTTTWPKRLMRRLRRLL